MVAIEVWEQRSVSSTAESDSSEEDVKNIPLFERLLPPPVASKTQDAETEETDDESDSDDCANFFESDFSEATEEPPPAVENYEHDWSRLQAVRAQNMQLTDSHLDPMCLPRVWDSVFYISSMQNLENTEQQFFYCIKVKHVDGEASRRYGLGSLMIYTPQFTLKSGECRTLQVPMFIWKRRKLTLPYGQLEKYFVEIEIWKTHRTRINSLYAVQHVTFKEVIERHANFAITLNRHIPESVIARATTGAATEKSQSMSITEASERRIPVHKVTAFFLLEEIFDFHFLFENWWFNMAPEMPAHLKLFPKSLKISVPKSTEGAWATKRTEASNNNYWFKPGMFCFRGTLRQLRYACFSASVYCLQKGTVLSKPPILIGTCVLSLKSVQEQPLVRGVVKKLAMGTRNMFSGTIQGNIRCCVKSSAISFFEDLKMRPAQPISGSALITQLDHRFQYLVVRVLKCDNLPASNTDSNTSDPMVKVKWDGIVNHTCVLESTVSPVYNQNMYFPIHLVDKRELTDPAFIRYSLPVDLSSKGPVVVEVWDNEDSSCYLLGSVEISLSRIYTHGILQQRSLVDGIYTEAQEDVDFEDEEEDDGVRVTYTGGDASSAPYRKHVTRTYSDSLTLTGATVPNRGKKATVSLEMYIIPPMPNDLYIPEDQTKHARTEIYRDISRRWKKEFDAFQISYNEKFPGAVNHRRFTCVTKSHTTFTDSMPSDLIPLCYFTKPIQVYIQLASPGELMHWIANFTYKEDSTTTVCNHVNIEKWQMPSRFTLTRKGGLQDRALLLCGCLLGLGYDAFVCKGTIKGGKQEHCWVMTRHRGGTVTFWETANKRVWHLPHRWNTDDTVLLQMNDSRVETNTNYVKIDRCDSSPPQTKEVSHEQDDGSSRKKLMNYEIYGNEYMPDVKVDIPNILRNNDMATPAASYPMTAHLLPPPDIEDNRERKQLSPLDPKPHLSIPGKTLVYLPYSSIEVVFNDKQLWGNLQNHHPACISYDLEKNTEWKPFLKVPITDSIMPDVKITAPLSDVICANTAKDIKNDLIEMMELMHAQSGRAITFSRDQQMDEHLDSLIDILEFRQRLDLQFDPGMPSHLYGWSTKVSEAKKAKEKIGEAVFNQGVPRALTTATATKQSVEGTVLGSEANASRLTPQSTKAINEDERADSEATTASSDESLAFSRRPVYTPYQIARINAMRVYAAMLQRRPHRTSLRQKIKQLVWSQPRHRSVVCDDECTDVPISPKRCKWRMKNGFFAIRIRRTSVSIKPPKLNIARALSNASLHLGMEGTNASISDEYTKRSKLSAYQLHSCASSHRKRKSIGSIQTLHPYMRCDVLPTHRQAPMKGRPMPIGRQVVNNRATYSAPIRSSNMRGQKPSLLHRFLTKLSLGHFPDPHQVPRFMVDMQHVLSERAFILANLEHKYPIPYEFKVHENREISKWNWYYNAEARQYAWRCHLPIPPNHTFIGTPIHFCTSDINEIRHILTSSRRFRKLLVTEVEKCINVIYVKVFPLLGGVLSTWVFLGFHVPWNTQ